MCSQGRLIRENIFQLNIDVFSPSESEFVVVSIEVVALLFQSFLQNFRQLLDYVCLVPRVFLPVFLISIIAFVLLFAIEAVVHLTLFDVDVWILISCCPLFGGAVVILLSSE
ncbi:Hypothetical_protein [Hexamita inflata]|uniref:Hypothetical_protein n=1 Tax=Hexamita inflata TaxID=28002 RepID=A0AA86TIG3_9EUKA|nr:Hypothetical protein HINF_LOCUS4532 [Hexamita inflata]